MPAAAVRGVASSEPPVAPRGRRRHDSHVAGHARCVPGVVADGDRHPVAARPRRTRGSSARRPSRQPCRPPIHDLRRDPGRAGCASPGRRSFTFNCSRTGVPLTCRPLSTACTLGASVSMWIVAIPDLLVRPPWLVAVICQRVGPVGQRRRRAKRGRCRRADERAVEADRVRDRAPALPRADPRERRLRAVGVVDAVQREAAGGLVELGGDDPGGPAGSLHPGDGGVAVDVAAGGQTFACVRRPEQRVRGDLLCSQRDRRRWRS